MTQAKLSNIVFKVGDFMTDHADVYYRAADATMTEGGCLQFTGSVDFLTYFNACAVAKWKQYAAVHDFRLHLGLKGDPCVVQVFGYSQGDEAPVQLMAPIAVVQDGCLDVKLPETDKQLVGFTLSSNGTTALEEGWFFTQVDEADLNPVGVALSTTTFRKEEYITANIALFKEEIAGADDDVAQHFHMYVVDNGRTLDVQGLTDENVTVIPNDNVGGAGGFARGMIASLEQQDCPCELTHVLLMDDDVRISTESLKRTYYLLRLVKGAYKNAFINGAMITMERPNLLFEDVSYVEKSAYYRSVFQFDHSLYIDKISNVADLVSVNVEVPNAYGAWWYSCIPLEAVRANGLPLPVFVRCDDVEYGVRCNPTYMVMNGICVWHEGFSGRFRPSVDCYQYQRNFAIMGALHECFSWTMYMAHLDRNVKLYLRSMYYDAVDLMLDGFEDFLKGPDYLASVSGEGLMKSNGAKNEKMLPIDEALAEEGLTRDQIVYNARMLNYDKSPYLVPLAKAFRTIPYDRHLLPDAMLREKPEAVPYNCWYTIAPRTVGTKTLVAINPEQTHAHIRHMDKDRYHALVKRWSVLKNRWRKERQDVIASYKQAQPRLTSMEFWKDYLGLE